MEYPKTTKNVGQPCVICGQPADAQATVEALRAIIKQMGEQACVLAKDGMAAKAQVEALQLERDEAIEAASLPTWVCDGCGRVSSDGWINHVIESLDGTDYEMECPTCGVRDIEEDCALDLVRERDDLQAALDAEREKVKFLEKKNANLVEASNLVLKVKADQDERIDELQTQLSALQGLVRVAVERWRAQTNVQEGISFRLAMKELERTLPATPTERGENHSGDDTDMVQKGGGDGE